MFRAAARFDHSLFKLNVEYVPHPEILLCSLPWTVNHVAIRNKEQCLSQKTAQANFDYS